MIKPAFYIAILFLTLVIPLQGQQNLVINGDFEDYSSCPDNASEPSQNPYQIEKCNNWKAPTFGTSDYFNSCSSNPIVQIPSNYVGFQEAHGGSAYSGFASIYQTGMGTDGYTGPMWWEYLQGQIISPLKQNVIYKFSMEISLAEYSDLMIKELGVYFSNTPLSSPNSASLAVVPQYVFYNSNYFQDTLNWIHLETYFIANGGEQYITIGNFRNNTNNDTLRRYDLSSIGLTNPNVTYFYLDDVVLTETSNEFSIPNVFTPNGDGINDNWYLPLSGGIGNEISILNRWGNLIIKSDLNGFKWDGKTQNGEYVDDGVYFYRITNTNIAGFIELIR